MRTDIEIITEDMGGIDCSLILGQSANGNTPIFYGINDAGTHFISLKPFTPEEANQALASFEEAWSKEGQWSDEIPCPEDYQGPDYYSDYEGEENNDWANDKENYPTDQ